MTDIHDIEEKDLEVNEENIDETVGDLDIEGIKEDFGELDIKNYTPNDEEIKKIKNGVETLWELSGEYLERIEEDLEEKDIDETSKQAIVSFLIEALIKTEVSAVIETLVPEDRREQLVDEVKETILNKGKELAELAEKAGENLTDEEKEQLKELSKEIEQ